MGLFDLFGDIAGFVTNKDALDSAQIETDNRKAALDRIKPVNTQFDPRMYKDPTNINYQQIALPDGMRDNQLAALTKMQQLANSDGNSRSNYERQAAIMGANRNAQNQSQSIMQNAAARNQGGGGMLEYLMRNQNAQDNSNNAGQLGLKAASDAALERLQAQGMYAQGLGSMRGQDQQLAGQNADIFNKFSTLNAERARDVSQRNTDLQNQAQQINYGRDVNNFNQQMGKWNAAAGPHGETLTNLGASAKNVGQFAGNLANMGDNIGGMAMGGLMGGAPASGGGMAGLGDFGGSLKSPSGNQAAAKSTNSDDPWNWYA